MDEVARLAAVTPDLDRPFAFDDTPDEGRHETGGRGIEVVMRSVDQRRPQDDSRADAFQPGTIPLELLLQEPVRPADAEPGVWRIAGEQVIPAVRAAGGPGRGRAHQHDTFDPSSVAASRALTPIRSVAGPAQYGDRPRQVRRHFVSSSIAPSRW
jgi:hypothetical protein